MSGRWVELEQLLDRVYHLSSPTTSADSNGQAEAAAFDDHVEKLEGPPIHRLVEIEVDRPDVRGYSARSSSRFPPRGSDRIGVLALALFIQYQHRFSGEVTPDAAEFRRVLQS